MYNLPINASMDGNAEWLEFALHCEYTACPIVIFD